MLRLFDTYAALFKSWHVICYEQEEENIFFAWLWATLNGSGILNSEQSSTILFDIIKSTL